MTSFTAQFGDDRLKLHFALDDQKNPIKLGDGTFGCVFRVQDSGFNDYALKIFYEPSDKFVEDSQKQEMSLGSRLREHFHKEGQHERLADIERYLVVSKGHVTDFKSSEAYKEFEDYFERLAFGVSDRAILMNNYPMSLKDVLERGWSRKKAVDDGSPKGRSGYSILRGIPQEEREKCILPIVRQIAEALSILRDADINHQDIKPANVLIREVGSEIEVALADLGFVNTGQFQVHGSIFQNQPLGTRHYRSPEQMDFFDICEVDIRPLGESKGYELRTQDPKFYRTFSEKGDLVVFSKLPEPTQWEIDEIDKIKGQSSDDGPKTTAIRIRGLEKTVLHEDVRTQITVNKKQTDRTDLFGLGAIIFDMLTCGESPEQFYNLLRVHDHEGKTIEESLSLQRYRLLGNDGGMVPEIDTIFRNMKADDDSTLPHPDLVAIILKCMMSKPLDSYWNSNSRWKSVKDDLDILIRKLVCEYYSKIQFNHLTSKGDSPIQHSQPRAGPLDILNEIQDLNYNDPRQCVKRLLLGVDYLRKIFHMVTGEMKRDSDSSFLADIAPSNLDGERIYRPQLVLFKEKEDFDKMIESGNPRALVQLFSAGGLRPPFINGLVCEGEIWVEEEQQEEESGDDKFCLGFEIWDRDDGSLYKGKGIGYQRVVLIDIPLNKKIEEIDYAQGKLYVKNKVKDKDRLSEVLTAKDGRCRAYFVKRFDRAHYYLAMFGIYIRLLFFVDPTKRQMHTPESIYFFEHGRSVGEAGFRPLPVLSASNKRFFGKFSSLGSLFSLMIGICARLSILEPADDKSSPEVVDTSSTSNKRFFGKSSSLGDLFSLMAGIYARLLTLELDDKSPLGAVYHYFDQIERAVSEVLRCAPTELSGFSGLSDRSFEGENGKNIPNIDDLVDNLVGDRDDLQIAEAPDINQLVRKNIIIDI